MTKLTKEIARETGVEILDSRGKTRLLTVTLEPGADGGRIVLRPKGCTVDTYAVSLADVWKLAVAPLNICHDCDAELDSRIGKQKQGGKQL